MFQTGNIFVFRVSCFVFRFPDPLPFYLSFAQVQHRYEYKTHWEMSSTTWAPEQWKQTEQSFGPDVDQQKNLQRNDMKTHILHGASLFHNRKHECNKIREGNRHLSSSGMKETDVALCSPLLNPISWLSLTHSSTATVRPLVIKYLTLLRTQRPIVVTREKRPREMRPHHHQSCGRLIHSFTCEERRDSPWGSWLRNPSLSSYVIFSRFKLCLWVPIVSECSKRYLIPSRIVLSSLIHLLNEQQFTSTPLTFTASSDLFLQHFLFPLVV